MATSKKTPAQVAAAAAAAAAASAQEAAASAEAAAKAAKKAAAAARKLEGAAKAAGSRSTDGNEIQIELQGGKVQGLENLRQLTRVSPQRHVRLLVSDLLELLDWAYRQGNTTKAATLCQSHNNDN